MRLIDADDFGNRMYHEAFEKDSDLQKWDSGCWIRYKLFENVLREQPTVEPEQRWIPCGERLPEENDCYLVQAMMNGDIFVAKWEGSYWNVKTPIIAWMPLPARYKGDDTERTILDLCRNWDDLLASYKGDDTE